MSNKAKQAAFQSIETANNTEETFVEITTTSKGIATTGQQSKQKPARANEFLVEIETA